MIHAAMDDEHMMKPPPLLVAAARICSIVGGVFHVSANFRLLSRKVLICESVFAIVAGFSGEVRCLGGIQNTDARINRSNAPLCQRFKGSIGVLLLCNACR